MNGFEFNKIYVLESLKANERLTGEELYNDLLKWKSCQIEDLKTEYISIENTNNFFQVLENIKQDCQINSVLPIIHFEIHGNEKGLSLKSDEFVTWNELSTHLIDINHTIGNNLFITLAVCYGAFIFELAKPINTCPFWGFIGSFKEIKEQDLVIRFNEFYRELLNEVNIQNGINLNNAINALHNANPNLPSTFNFFNSQEIFINVYKKYLKEEFTNDIKEKRFGIGLKQINKKLNRNEKVENKILFKNSLMTTKKKFFENHKKIFFMYEKFPQNIEKFIVTFDEVNNID